MELVDAEPYEAPPRNMEHGGRHPCQRKAIIPSGSKSSLTGTAEA